MSKHIIKIIAILLVSTLIIIPTQIQAVGIDDLVTNPDGYIQGGGDDSELVNFGNLIVWVIRTVGTSISIVMLMIIGIKYIRGSVEEKAEYKQTMWPYIVGALLIFSGTSFVNIIYEMMTKQ